MRRGRLYLLLGLVLLVLVAAVAILLPRLLSGAESPVQEFTEPQALPTATPEPVNVVITTQRIARAEIVSEDVVTLVTISRDDPLAQLLITDIRDVIGKRSKFDLDPGIFLTPGMIVDSIEQLSASGSEAALQIPKGYVAVSIPISRLSSVSYGLRRGDQVNVIMTVQMVDLDTEFQSLLPSFASALIAPGPTLVTSSSDAVTGSATASISTDELVQILTAQVVAGGAVSPIGRLELNESIGQPFYIIPSEPQRPRMVSQTLIYNAIVLQLGDFKTVEQEEYERELAEIAAQPTPVPDQEDQAPVQAQPPEKPPLPDVITLIVSPQDAVTLNYAMMQNAILTLAMRSARDQDIIQTEAVTLQYLLNQYNIPVPSKLPFGLQPRIDMLSLPVPSNDAQTPVQEP